MEKMERKCTGIWFPIDIWESRNYRLLEKFIIAEVDSLDKGKGCWASNAYLSGLAGCDQKTISRCINDLKKRELLKTWTVGGSQRRMKVTEKGWTNCLPPGQNVPTPGQNVQPPPQNVPQYNTNTDINTTTSNEIKKYYLDKQQEKLLKKTGVGVIRQFDKIENEYLTTFLQNFSYNIPYAKKLIDQFIDDKVSSVYSWAKSTDYSFKAFNHKLSELMISTPRTIIKKPCDECGKTGGHQSTCSVLIKLKKASENRSADIKAGRKLITSLGLSATVNKIIEEKRGNE